MPLNNPKKIKELDTGLVSESIDALPEQIAHIVKVTKKINIPKTYKNVTQIVVSGMGGSNLGTGIIKAALADQLKLPITISAGYQVPAHVNKNTLYILSSYSGTTEEPLSTYKEAKKRGAKILIITAGGKLEKLITKENIPGLIFNPEKNPSNQPRLGLGYSIFGTILLMKSAGLINVTKQETENIVKNLTTWNKQLTITTPSTKNQAKKIAKQIHNTTPVILGAEHLMGNLRALRNQFCENSKNFATYLSLPEMNHYALEGLAHPISNQKDLHFIFFDSKLYHKRIQKRSLLTKQVVKKNQIKFSTFDLVGKTKLEQAFEMLQAGTWITYYLGILNGVDPVKIPWVDWFKAELK